LRLALDSGQCTTGCHSSPNASSAEPLITKVSNSGVSSWCPGTSQQESTKSSPNASGTTDLVPPVPATRVLGTLGHSRSNCSQDGAEVPQHFNLAADDWFQDEDEYFPAASLG